MENRVKLKDLDGKNKLTKLYKADTNWDIKKKKVIFFFWVTIKWIQVIKTRCHYVYFWFILGF